MIKYLFIVINSLSLFIFSLFNSDNAITITNTIPATMVAGQETAFELKIDKGSMNGFAKLQLDLPEGMVVKQSDDKGATYDFTDGIAKWVWAVLPADNEIVIKVVVQASENSLGVKTITAKYSYVENNVKQQVDMTPVEVNVLAPVSAVSNTAPAPAAVTGTAVTDSLALSKMAAPLVPGSNNEPQSKIEVLRTITKVSDKEYNIDLKIKKGITKGFAKYSDDVIEGTTTKAVKTDGSSYSIADGKLKFVWVTVPEKDELEISYTITGNFAKEITLNGEYSYLENNQSKKFKVNPETIPAAGNAPSETKTEVKQPEPAATETVAVKEPEAEKKANVPAEQLSTNTPEPATPATTEKKEASANYMVQIGAFTNSSVTDKLLKQKFKITEKIRSDMQGGFSKFMIGSHKEYRDARYHSETVKDINGIKSAFVVAYNGSQRITVQEALMISNQKWFK